jgi:hypothetical protein
MTDLPDLPELRRLAEAATPGPWYAGAAGSDGVVCFGGDDITMVAPCANTDNRDYIAAVNPTTVIAQ